MTNIQIPAFLPLIGEKGGEEFNFGYSDIGSWSLFVIWSLVIGI
jgi:hypothetical protein